MLLPLSVIDFENIVGKGENTDNQYFSLSYITLLQLKCITPSTFELSSAIASNFYNSNLLLFSKNQNMRDHLQSTFFVFSSKARVVQGNLTF